MVRNLSNTREVDESGANSIITLGAVCNTNNDEIVSYQWYYSTNGGKDWISIANETNSTYTYTFSFAMWSRSWKVTIEIRKKTFVMPDTSALAPKASPEFTGSISLGRKANTTIGENSFAVGNDCEASGNQSHAEGYTTKASAQAAHAEGIDTQATGSFAHAEGNNTRATGAQSHAEGCGDSGYGALGKADHAEGYLTKANSGSGSTNYGAHAEGRYSAATGNSSHAEGNSTMASGINSHAEGDNAIASGTASHAEGFSTIANGGYSHAQGYGTNAAKNNQTALGQYNVKDNFALYPEWEANKTYAVGDKIKKTFGSSVSGYKCKTDNNDATFTSSNWTAINIGNFAEIVGNGTGDNVRSNARVLTWEGDERLMGDVYVGCNSDSTGGNKLATEAFVTARIPSPPSADGTYTLQVSVASGTATYSWV